MQLPRPSLPDRRLRQPSTAGIYIDVLPGASDRLISAARMAGLKIRFLDIGKWPFSPLVMRYALGDGARDLTLVGQPEVDFHNMVRDDFARNMNMRGAARRSRKFL